jgi:hypothetical protein
MAMLRTQHWTLERPVGASFFRATRNAVPLDLGIVDEEMATVAKMFANVDTKRLGVLVDLRGGPPLRRDEEFVGKMGPLWAQVLLRFRRVALLVGTAVGKLQTERLAKGWANPPRVFSEEASAVAYLREG